MNVVRIWSYGNYSSGNYGVNAMAVQVGDLDIYFSYRTPVAFRSLSTGLVVRKNSWGPTTGKHLNWIDGGSKKTRVNSSVFEAQLEELVGKAYAVPVIQS